MARSSLYPALVGELEKRVSRMAIGSFLPSEQALAESFQVSKPTLRRALAELARRNLIRTINGVGNLVTGNSRVISRELVFLCYDLTFFALTLREFSRAAAEANYLSSIIPLCGDAASQERILNTAIARNPAGMVVYADPDRNDKKAFPPLVHSGIPTLFLVRLPQGIDGNLLTFENGDAIAKIVRLLYREKCRRFALYSNAGLSLSATRERKQGFLEGLKRCRLKARLELLRTRESSPEETERFFEQFRHAGKRPDAVCCLNDVCAGDLIRDAHRRGIRLDGIRLSGFDHASLTAFLPHELLTVKPPFEELGKCAAELLIRQIENPGFGFIRKKLESRLISIQPTDFSQEETTHFPAAK